DLAFLLAAHGYRLHPSVQTEGALLTSVANLPEFKRRILVDAPVSTVAISDAADRVWIGTTDGKVVSQSFTSGTELGRSDGQLVGEVVATAPARAGSDAVVVAGSGVVATLDGDLQVSTMRTTEDAVTALAVGPSTGRIAAGTAGGSVIVWDAGGSAPSMTFPVVERGA
ncbi:WD40 repeat domain-containing protein, partial [Mycolicibacterium elephantis]